MLLKDAELRELDDGFFGLPAYRLETVIDRRRVARARLQRITRFVEKPIAPPG